MPYTGRSGFTPQEVDRAYQEILTRAEGSTIDQAINRHHAQYHALVATTAQLTTERAHLIYLLKRQQAKMRGATAYAKECHNRMEQTIQEIKDVSKKRGQDRLKDWAIQDELIKANSKLCREKFDVQSRNVFTMIWAIAATGIAGIALLVHFVH